MAIRRYSDNMIHFIVENANNDNIYVNVSSAIISNDRLSHSQPLLRTYYKLSAKFMQQ